jgi:hypothetical protein|tara:strand:+ start:51 stop:548 length:498 start_codon:yes stop_codon:yes gene_type:complete
MDRNVIVVDNFLDDPDRIRNIALSFDYSNVQNNVPGVRSSSRAGGEYEDKVTEKFREIFNSDIEWCWEQDSFCFQLCTEGTESWIHQDPVAEWAAVLYLTPNAPLDSGTGIYESPNSDMNVAVGNMYNRLVAYRGKMMYHRSIVPGFGDSLETGRLTQVFFFDVK